MMGHMKSVDESARWMVCPMVGARCSPLSSEERLYYTDTMSKILFSTLAALTLSGTILSSTMVAGENQMMHCFAFTAKADATPADWAAFYAATNALPKKMPLVKSVWVGKLRRPLTQYAPDAETAKLFKIGRAHV